MVNSWFQSDVEDGDGLVYFIEKLSWCHHMTVQGWTNVHEQMESILNSYFSQQSKLKWIIKYAVVKFNYERVTQKSKPTRLLQIIPKLIMNLPLLHFYPIVDLVSLTQ